MTKEAILGVARHILTFLGGFAVARGWVDGGTVETVVGGLITIGGALWSVFDKKQRTTATTATTATAATTPDKSPA